MKPYFAKFLPVEGEIKEGDTWMSKREGTVAPFPASKIAIEAWNESEEARKNVTKMKLFLCSRDIQVGDTLKAYDGSGNFILTKETRVGMRGKLISPVTNEESEGDATHSQIESDWFKVLGEISPEATWVKDGDEFDEEDIQIQYQVMPSSFDQWCKINKDGYNNYTDKYPKRILCLIKGLCGHFH